MPLKFLFLRKISAADIAVQSRVEKMRTDIERSGRTSGGFQYRRIDYANCARRYPVFVCRTGAGNVSLLVREIVSITDDH